MSGLMEQMLDDSALQQPFRCSRGWWVRHSCNTQRFTSTSRRTLSMRTGTYLEHQPEEEHHSNTRNNVCMVLDDELVAHHRRVLVALFPDAHVDAARQPPSQLFFPCLVERWVFVSTLPLVFAEETLSETSRFL